MALWTFSCSWDWPYCATFCHQVFCGRRLPASKHCHISIDWTPVGERKNIHFDEGKKLYDIEMIQQRNIMVHLFCSQETICVKFLLQSEGSFLSFSMAAECKVELDIFQGWIKTFLLTWELRWICCSLPKTQLLSPFITARYFYLHTFYFTYSEVS